MPLNSGAAWRTASTPPMSQTARPESSPSSTITVTSSPALTQTTSAPLAGSSPQVQPLRVVMRASE